MEPRNRFQGMNSTSLCSLAGRYDNPIPPRFLAPIVSLKIPALDSDSDTGSPSPIKSNLISKIPYISDLCQFHIRLTVLVFHILVFIQLFAFLKQVQNSGKTRSDPL
jgi:hypothetical protein